MVDVIKKGEHIDLYIKNKLYEGVYHGTHNDYVLAKIEDKKIKIPFHKISFMESKKSKTPSEEISKFRKICEGEILPNVSNTLKIDVSTGELLDILMKLNNNDMDTETDYSGALMTFHNSDEYNKVISFLKKYGYKYKNIGDPNTFTDSDIGHKENTTSPYPKNVHED